MPDVGILKPEFNQRNPSCQAYFEKLSGGCDGIFQMFVARVNQKKVLPWF
jgi:hypothetical protein